MKGGDYCKEIMTAFKVNNHHQIGIIKFSGKGYAYYQHPVGYRMSLIFVVDPERYLSLMKLQTEKDRIYLSHYMISTIMRNE